MESSSSSKGNMVVRNQRKGFEGMRMENPFSFKVLQLFTGFGFGCGVGVGVGGPFNLGKIPMMGDIMSATRGATDAFSSVSRHVNNTLRKFGIKQVQAGLGCGLGFGYGFGLGLAVKPSVVHQIQSFALQGMEKMMMKLGMVSNPNLTQDGLPTSLHSGVGMVNEPSSQNPMGNIMQLATKIPEPTSQLLPDYGNALEKFVHRNTPVDTTFGSSEKVIRKFQQNPVLRGVSIDEVAGRLRSENNVLQVVLKHQQIIEELMKENEKLRQILVEDLKIPSSKLQSSSSSRINPVCTDCFECRRKQRKK